MTSLHMRKKKGSGYILETRGWQSILEHDSLDFSLIICIIIVMTALWGNEYETQIGHDVKVL